ncbi:MAG: lipopolysaccharide heptosyltransferase I [Deltaproteobacteria bacterium]|nr:MAG: lipopolysaccharide heptosyltransferase I [Deltaproteobacteria bacterium]
MKILIVKLSAIGDVIHTLPALCALRRHWPGARIDWVVEEAAADLVAGHPDLDRVIVSRRKAWILDWRDRARRAGMLAEINRFVGELRRTRYDLVLDFQALLKSALVVALARGRRKVGFGRGLEHMEHSYHVLTEGIRPPSMEVHALTRNLMMVQALGVPVAEVAYRLPVTDADRSAVGNILKESGVDESRPLVAINPVAQWPTKLWPEERFALLADRLLERYDASVVFTGGGGDRRVVERIIGTMKRPALDLSGRTSLKQLAALYQRARLVISTDTGPMHLAAAAGTPVVALFGPTAPWRTGPFGPGHHIVRAPAPCAPCFKRRCQAGGCMNRIPVERVLAAVEKVGLSI